MNKQIERLLKQISPTGNYGLFKNVFDIVPKQTYDDTWTEGYYTIGEIRDGRKDNNVTGVNLLSIDLDECQKLTNFNDKLKWLTEFKDKFEKQGKWIKPSMIIFSGGGFHIHWFLDAPLSQPEAKKYFEAIANYYECKDKSTSDAGTQLLRLPGTWNNKYTPPEKCRIIFPQKEDAVCKVYNISEFSKMLDKSKTNSSEYVKPKNVLQKFEDIHPGNLRTTFWNEVVYHLELGHPEKKVRELLMDKYSKQGLDEKSFDEQFASAAKYTKIKNIKNPKVIEANKFNSKINFAAREGNYKEVVKLAQEIEEEPEEIVFLGLEDIVETKRVHYNTESDLWNNSKLFQSGTVTIFAAETGAGKTTLALNLLRSFLVSDPNVNTLLLESESEEPLEDIKTKLNTMKFNDERIRMKKFKRTSNAKEYFKTIFDQYKIVHGKYPDIVFVDTIEKMLSDSQNFNIKIASEILATLSQELKICFIVLSQFSSPFVKENHKKQNQKIIFSAQQGGTDVVSNVTNWASFQRIPDKPNHLVNAQITFSKCRGTVANQTLNMQPVNFDIDQETLIIDFVHHDIQVEG